MKHFFVFGFLLLTIASTVSACSEYTGTDAVYCSAHLGCFMDSQTLACEDVVNHGDTACQQIPNGPDFALRCSASRSDCAFDAHNNICYQQGYPSADTCAAIAVANCNVAGCQTHSDGAMCVPINCAAYDTNSCIGRHGCYVDAGECKVIPVGPCATLTQFGSQVCHASLYSKCAWAQGVCYEENFFPGCVLQQADSSCVALSPLCVWSETALSCHTIGETTGSAFPYWVLPYWATASYTSPAHVPTVFGGSWTGGVVTGCVAPNNCGDGLAFHPFTCYTTDFKHAADVDCIAQNVQHAPSYDLCNMGPCVTYTWRTWTLGTCDGPCGQYNTQTITKLCVPTTDLVTPVDESFCVGVDKGSLTQACYQDCVLTGCRAATTPETCVANGCLWDVYLPVAVNNPETTHLCYQGIAAVMHGRTCADWSGLATPNTAACAYHGCALVGSMCVNVDSGSTTTNDDLTTQVSVTAGFINPMMSVNSFRIQFDVVIAYVFSLTNPVWVVISFGDNQWLATHPPIMNNGMCNSLGSWDTVGPVPVVYTGTHPNVEAYCTEWVNTHGNFAFDNSPEGIACIGMSGGSNNLFVGGNSVVTTTNLNTPGTLNAHVDMDLTDLANHCGIDVIPFPNASPPYVQYIVTPRVTVRGLKQTLGDAVGTFFVNFVTGGTVTITSNSRHRQTVVLQHVRPTYHGCAIGQQRLNATYLLTYNNIANSAEVIGPRSKADIVFPTGLSCYGEVTQSLSLLPYRLDLSAWQFEYQTLTACFDIAADGLAFFTCARAPDYDTQQWSATLDQQHTHTIDTWRYPVGDPSSVTAARENGNLAGDPDTISSLFAVSVYPNVIDNNNVYEQKFRITGSLLPTPASPLSTEMILATANPEWSSLENTRDFALTHDKSLTFILHLDAVILDTYDLVIRTGVDDLKFIPVDTNGVDIAGGRVVYWSDIKTMVSHTTKRELELYPDVPQVTLQACTSHRGCDGFAVPVVPLRAISGQVAGYRTIISADVRNPEITAPHRRLLALPGNNGTQIISASITSIFFFSDTPVIIDQIGNDTLIIRTITFNNTHMNHTDLPIPNHLDQAQLKPDWLALTGFLCVSIGVHFIVMFLVVVYPSPLDQEERNRIKSITETTEDN